MKLQPAEWAPLLKGGDYSDIYFEESVSTRIHFEENRVEEILSGEDRGLGLRLMKKRGDPKAAPETLYASLNRWSLDEARETHRRLLGGKVPSNGRRPAADFRGTRHASPVVTDPFGVPLERKVALLEGINAAVRERSPLIRQVSLSYAERLKRFWVLNSDGEFHEEERTSVLLSAQVVAEEDRVLQTGHEVLGAIKGWELLEETDPYALAMKAAERALTKLKAPKAKAGEMPVVIASEAGGTLIHEAIGHSLEADHIQEGSSPMYHGKIGRTVAPEFLTIIDDPTLPFYRGSFAYDDEGTRAKPTVLVERGVLKDYLYDRVTAGRDGVASNAHGRRESYHHRPIPRMSNLYIAPGQDDPAKILKELDRGLLVTRMGGGQVNTATGEFVFEVDEGFWVEKGKVKHLVRDANLLGVGPEILMSVDRLGWDIGWAIGTCGKDGQGVPVADGVPTLRIPKILVGGRHEGGE